METMLFETSDIWQLCVVCVYATALFDCLLASIFVFAPHRDVWFYVFIGNKPAMTFYAAIYCRLYIY